MNCCRALNYILYILKKIHTFQKVPGEWLGRPWGARGAPGGDVPGGPKNKSRGTCPKGSPEGPQGACRRALRTRQGSCRTPQGSLGVPMGVMRQEKVVENIMKYTTINSKLMAGLFVGFCNISGGSLGGPWVSMGVPGCALEVPGVPLGVPLGSLGPSGSRKR